MTQIRGVLVVCLGHPSIHLLHLHHRTSVSPEAMDLRLGMTPPAYTALTSTTAGNPRLNVVCAVGGGRGRESEGGESESGGGFEDGSNGDMVVVGVRLAFILLPFHALSLSAFPSQPRDDSLLHYFTLYSLLTTSLQVRTI